MTLPDLMDTYGDRWIIHAEPLLATRRHQLPVGLLGALAMTLYADTVTELRDALAEQARRERDIAARKPG